MISKEIKLARAEFKHSMYDDDGGKEFQIQKKKILDKVDDGLKKKVDLNEFKDSILTKTSKKDHEMVVRHVQLVHKQLQ